jgi:hypothetical protein
VKSSGSGEYHQFVATTMVIIAEQQLSIEQATSSKITLWMELDRPRRGQEGRVVYPLLRSEGETIST